MSRSLALMGGALLAAACGSGFVAVGNDAGAEGGAGEGGTSGESGGMPSSFVCGNTSCTPVTQTCCSIDQGTASCVDAQICPNNNDLALHCTSSRDCLGQLCCFQQVQGGGVSVCAPSCQNGLPLCNPKASGECASMQHCTTNPNGGFNLPPWLGGCQSN